MRRFLATAALLLVPTTASAHPGGHTLSCTSRKGAKQSVKLELQRMNGLGWASPSFTITVDGTAHAFTTDDPTQSFGTTFHDAPLGVILVTADNSADPAATAFGGFTVMALPRSVKATDNQGQRVTWRIEDEDDPCYDSSGKARFRAAFRGWLRDDAGATTLGAQVLDCELDYDSGMSC